MRRNPMPKPIRGGKMGLWQLIEDRDEAKRLGLLKYYTGEPCPLGHLSPRSVSTGGCIACVEVARQTPAVSTAKIAERLEKRAQREASRKYGALRPDPTRAKPSECECCGRHESVNENALHLDHCHTTGKFRGWLCSQCNSGIGMLGDHIEGLKKAVAYMEANAPWYVQYELS